MTTTSGKPPAGCGPPGSAGACHPSRGRPGEPRAGAAAYGARDEGATAANRMENVVLPRAAVIVFT